MRTIKTTPNGRPFIMRLSGVGFLQPPTALGIVMPITAKYELRHFHPQSNTDRGEKKSSAGQGSIIQHGIANKGASGS
jgi:hypothetical protein